MNHAQNIFVSQFQKLLLLWFKSCLGTEPAPLRYRWLLYLSQFSQESLLSQQVSVLLLQTDVTDTRDNFSDHSNVLKRHSICQTLFQRIAQFIVSQQVALILTQNRWTEFVTCFITTIFCAWTVSGFSLQFSRSNAVTYEISLCEPVFYFFYFYWARLSFLEGCEFVFAYRCFGESQGQNANYISPKCK